MFASNALIGLREGLEAALVVVILVAFLVKTDRRWALRYVWIGVGAAVALSVAVAAGLTLGSRELPESVEETVTGVASLIAVGLVTAMIFWMRATARSVAGDLTGRLGRAVDIGPWAVALVGFLGVGREGLETALFVFASVQAAGEGSSAPLLGWVVGLLAAVVLGLAIYQGAVRIDLAKFFRWTGVVLVFVELVAVLVLIVPLGHVVRLVGAGLGTWSGKLLAQGIEVHARGAVLQPPGNLRLLRLGTAATHGRPPHRW